MHSQRLTFPINMKEMGKLLISQCKEVVVVRQLQTQYKVVSKVLVGNWKLVL